MRWRVRRRLCRLGGGGRWERRGFGPDTWSMGGYVAILGGQQGGVGQFGQAETVGDMEAWKGTDEEMKKEYEHISW